MTVATGSAQLKTLQLDQASGSVQIVANGSQSGTYVLTVPVLSAAASLPVWTATPSAGYIPYSDGNGNLSNSSSFTFSSNTLTVGSVTFTTAGVIAGATTITCSSTITSTGGGLAIAGTITGATTVALNEADFSSQSASSTDGAMWYDSTQKCITSRLVGLNMPVGGTMFVSTASVSAISNAGPTSMIGTGVGTLTIPANFLVAGRSIRLEIAGTISTGSATPTLNLFLTLGGSNIVTTGAKAQTTSITTGDFYCIGILTARAAPGASVAVYGNIAFINNNATATPTMTGANGTANFTTNGSLALDFTCTTAAGTGTTTVTPTMAIVTVIA